MDKITIKVHPLNGTLGISQLANLSGKDLDKWTLSDVRTVWNESLGHLLDSFQLLFHFGCEFDCSDFSDKESFLESLVPKDIPSNYLETVALGRKMILDLFARMDRSQLNNRALAFFQMVAFRSAVSMVLRCIASG